MSTWWAPRPYQPLMYDFAMRVKRCALFVPMGFGKSSVLLWLIDTWLLAGMARKVLIVAPKRVALSTWPGEVKQWANFAHLRVSVVLGSPQDRTAALGQDADIYCINYDNLVWLVETLGDAWFFDVVVADEGMRLKGFRLRQGTKRARALAKVIHSKVKRFVLLTGTPAANGLQDLWAILWFIDQGFRLGRTFSDFQDRWFGFQRNVQAHTANKAFVKRVAFPFAQQEIHDKIADVCFTLKVSDWFDIAEPIVNRVYVDIPPKARKHYRDMEREMFTRLGEHEIEAFGAAAKTIKCAQIAGGAPYLEGSNTKWEVLHDEKLDALDSIIEEAAGVPVLVAYNFKSDLARLLDRFPQGRALDASPKTIEDWNAGRVPVLFAHPASAGHGLSLQHGGNILAFFALNWNLEEHMQIIERIGPVRQKQSGYDRPVFVHYILARDTVDEMMLDRLQNKREVQEVLLDALKRYHENERASTAPGSQVPEAPPSA